MDVPKRALGMHDPDSWRRIPGSTYECNSERILGDVIGVLGDACVTVCIVCTYVLSISDTRKNGVSL